MRSMVAPLMLVALAACERNDTAKRDDQTVTNAPSRESAARADNTGRNERDRDTKAPTPGDQKENEADRSITKDLRQAVVGRDDLSSNAKNVKIITRDGVVTLRGPVESEAEKGKIVNLAKQHQGVKSVDPQLEVNGK